MPYFQPPMAGQWSAGYGRSRAVAGRNQGASSVPTVGAHAPGGGASQIGAAGTSAQGKGHAAGLARAEAAALEESSVAPAPGGAMQGRTALSQGNRPPSQTAGQSQTRQSAAGAASRSSAEADQDLGGRTQIIIEEKPAQIRVSTPPPEVNVRQPAPNVTIQQPPPNVSVRQTKPEIEMRQAAPQVRVEAQNRPDVQGRPGGQPDVRSEKPGGAPTSGAGASQKSFSAFEQQPRSGTGSP
jgi:hypothetical protein